MEKTEKKLLIGTITNISSPFIILKTNTEEHKLKYKDELHTEIMSENLESPVVVGCSCEENSKENEVEFIKFFPEFNLKNYGDLKKLMASKEFSGLF